MAGTYGGRAKDMGMGQGIWGILGVYKVGLGSWEQGMQILGAGIGASGWS